MTIVKIVELIGSHPKRLRCLIEGKQFRFLQVKCYSTKKKRQLKARKAFLQIEKPQKHKE